MRSFAVILGLLFGYMLGVFQFIDVASPSTGAILASIAMYTTVGMLLQAGLFWSPAAATKGRAAILSCVAAMLPMPILVAAQLGDLVTDIIRSGYGVLAGHLRGDGVLYTIFLTILAVYVYALFLLAQAFFDRPRSHELAA